jgi:hypothetical protein
MKKLHFLSFFFVFSLLAYGQIPNSITTNMNFVFNNSLTLSGTRSIGNNAVVSIRATEITINSNFSAAEGTNVTLTATGSSSLRSASTEDVSDDADSAENTITSIVSVEEAPAIESIKIYSLTGSLIYTSDSHFDIQSLPLNDGIYILEKRFTGGDFEFQKVILRK